MQSPFPSFTAALFLHPTFEKSGYHYWPGMMHKMKLPSTLHKAQNW